MAAAGSRRGERTRPTGSASSCRRPTVSTGPPSRCLPSALPSPTDRPRRGSSLRPITRTRAAPRRTPTGGSSSSASRTAGSSSPRDSSNGRAGSSSRRRHRPSCRSTQRRSSASELAMSSRSRTTTSEAGCRSSMRRSKGSADRPMGSPSVSGDPTRGRSSRSTSTR